MEGSREPFTHTHTHKRKCIRSGGWWCVVCLTPLFLSFFFFFFPRFNNLIAMKIVSCMSNPPKSNHLWSHSFVAIELKENEKKKIRFQESYQESRFLGKKNGA